MKLDPSKCTVVVVGSWNPAIFNPDWVSAQLKLPNKSTLRAEVAFSGGLITYRFSTEKVVLELHPGRLQVAPEATGSEFAAGSPEAALRDVEEAAKGIANALPVTPLTAFGVNFAWQVNRAHLRSDFVAVPELGDVEATGYSVQAVTAVRVFTDARSVRTTLTISDTHETHVHIQTNQHREVRKCEGIVKQLELLADYEAAKRLVEYAYVTRGENE